MKEHIDEIEREVLDLTIVRLIVAIGTERFTIDLAKDAVQRLAALDRMNASLVEQRDRMRDERDKAKALLARFGERTEELATLLIAAEKNSRRYEWLRDGDNDELVLRVFGADDQTPSREFDIGIDYCYLPRGETLDAAIDAALAEKVSP